MNILEMLAGGAGQGGGDTVGAIASSLGMDSGQTRQVMEKLVPALSAGIKKNASSADGLASLTKALQSGNHSQYLSDPSRLASAAGVTDGNAILGHILGSKDMSRNLASAASQNTGVDASAIKKMLPMVAAAVMGAMSKQGQATAGLGQQTGQTNLGGLLGSFLDTDKDGSVADDLLGMASKLFGR